jgi:hypothetical protein
MQRLRTRLRAGATAFPPATFALNFLTGALDSGVTFARGTTATFVGSDGLIQTAAINAPRFDYDPVTLAAKGLLIEEQRTNLLVRSAEFDNASWLKSDATVTANATTAPDGTSTADKLAETATTAGHYLYQSAGSAATHTASIYAKAAERSWLIVTVNSSNTFFNVSNGTVGSAPSGFTAAITDAGNGWYRCSVTATLPASGAIVFWTSTANNVTSYAGTAGSGIFIWGAQLEAGAFATSYIPTVASQVTRSPDAATMTGTNFSSWYSQTEGTFVSEASTFKPTATGAVGIVYQPQNGSNSFIDTIYSTASIETRVFVSSVSQSTIPVAYVFGVTDKMALAYKANDFASTRNGILIGTDASGTVPTGIDRMGIGGSATPGTGLFPLNGHIRQIAYYNTRLPNATLQALTA